MGLPQVKASIPLQQKGRAPSEATGLLKYSWHRRYSIPVNRPAAFQFYLNYLTLPHSLPEMLLTNVSRRWPWFGSALLHLRRRKNGHASLLEPLAVISNSRHPDIQHLDSDLRRHLNNAGIETFGSLALLTLNDHKDQRREKIIAFIFDDSSEQPLAIAKLSMDPHQGSLLQFEHETLVRFGRNSLIEKKVGMPQPLGFFKSSQWMISLESCLQGHSAYYEMRNSWNALEHAQRHLRAALNWIIGFQREAGIRTKSMNHSTLHDYVVAPLRQYAVQGCASESELRLIEKTINLAKRFMGTRVAVTAGHGDFWAGNLILHRNRVSVVDWESFRPEALSFDDLFFFSTTYGMNFPYKAVHWAVPETAFRATYLQPTEIANLVRDCLLDYCQAMDMNAGLLEVFFPVFLASKAVEEISIKSSAGASYKATEPAAKSKQSMDRAVIWKNLFRFYADSREPACFIHRAKSLEAVS